MADQSEDSRSSTRDLLSKVSRYEAFFELSDVINAATDIEAVGDALARRLKYVADIYAWRYICVDAGPDSDQDGATPAILVDGIRGRAAVTRTKLSALSGPELTLWRDRKTRILADESMRALLEHLPENFRKDDLEQISVNTLVESGRTVALYLFCKRRNAFSGLDIKCISMVSNFFHRKVHMLWEQQKLRDLELAYLKQEVMLRQSEKLATLGRLSAGMAHELNNPAAVAREGTEALRASLGRLERAKFALGAAGLSSTQLERLAQLEAEGRDRAKEPGSLDPLARSDREQEVEDWLGDAGVEEPWEHATTLVSMGLTAAALENMTKGFDPALAPIVIDYLSSKFAATALLEEIGHGVKRISEIVRALKGYSFMDQAPLQEIDVRDGLRDTLVMLGSRLRDGVQVDVDFAHDLPRIQGYGGELNQVWTNLIDNAISAMGGKGTLGLKTFRQDDWVVVEVADSGSGIPPAAQGKIFDPFFTTKAPGEGTGLGLNISHSIIVEKHKGRISVDSKPGATRFTVKLPISVAAARHRDTAAPESS